MKLYRNLAALLIFLFSICVYSCSPVDPNSVVVETPTPAVTPLLPEPAPTPTPEIGPLQTGTVSFKGVNVATSIPGVTAVQPSKEPAYTLHDPTARADGVAPEHILLKFLGPYPDRVEKSFCGQPDIGIYPVDGYRDVLAISEEGVKSTYESFDALKKILSTKPAALQEMPRINFGEGTENFITHIKYISFRNGRGVLYLTPFAMEIDLVRNHYLTYIFQGFTSDGKYYVLGTFPVRSTLLPEWRVGAKEHLGYRIPQPYFGEEVFERNEAGYKKYIAKVRALLAKQSTGHFEPNLDSIEKTISSLEVNW